jgi:hypothetical protein
MMTVKAINSHKLCVDFADLVKRRGNEGSTVFLRELFVDPESASAPVSDEAF